MHLHQGAVDGDGFIIPDVPAQGPVQISALHYG
jgi:hypothetical protein